MVMNKSKKQPRIICTFSGGKDSHACLIWACKKYGPENVTSLFCNTGWENPITYDHIQKTVEKLGVNHVEIKSKKYDGMLDLATKRTRFPSSKARFCTTELKSIPMNDFVLDLNESCIIIQGIRRNESHARSKFAAQCAYWKHYFFPYKYKKDNTPVYLTYRKKDVVKWVEKYTADIIRPVFEWTGQQVIDYITDNGHEPNPLYKMGMNRVGCFPCIMARHNEVLTIIKRFPEQLQKLAEHEIKTGSTFFAPRFIPEWAGRKDEKGRSINKIEDVIKYLTGKNATIDMFEESHFSCSSYYNLCE